jgi:hypothetical protein
MENSDNNEQFKSVDSFDINESISEHNSTDKMFKEVKTTSLNDATATNSSDDDDFHDAIEVSNKINNVSLNSLLQRQRK